MKNKFFTRQFTGSGNMEVNMLRLRLFVITQIILYLIFLSIDLYWDNGTLSGVIKYIIVILCLIYVLQSKAGDTTDRTYVRAGLFFTMISDWILLFMEGDIYFYGVLSFIITQQIYGFRLKHIRNADIEIDSHSKGRHHRQGMLWSWLIRLGIQITCAVAVYIILDRFAISLDLLLAVTVFYFISLVYNVIYSFQGVLEDSKDRRGLMFLVGLLLFLLCDINVGMFNLSHYLTLPEQYAQVIHRWSSVLMWTFYAPSQVIIALSFEVPSKSTKKNKNSAISVK